MTTSSIASPPKDSTRLKAYFVLLIMPLFFSSNMIFGRAIIANIEPFQLAFLRWLLTAIILLAFCLPAFKRHLPDFKAHWKELMLLGFLGMWICGALVYLALKYTTASNGALIYTSSSVIIIMLEWAYRGRSIGLKEFLGIPLAIIGVAIIVFRGDLNVLLALQLNPGDLLILVCAIAWAFYSFLLRKEQLSKVPTVPLLSVIAFAGALSLLPFAIAETAFVAPIPTDLNSWIGIAAIVFISSIFPFTAHQFGTKVLGASIAGVFLYLTPPYGIILAVVFLGEELAAYHFAGFVLIIIGMILATMPRSLFKR